MNEKTISPFLETVITLMDRYSKFRSFIFDEFAEEIREQKLRTQHQLSYLFDQHVEVILNKELNFSFKRQEKIDYWNCHQRLCEYFKDTVPEIDQYILNMRKAIDQMEAISPIQSGKLLVGIKPIVPHLCEFEFSMFFKDIQKDDEKKQLRRIKAAIQATQQKKVRADLNQQQLKLRFGTTIDWEKTNHLLKIVFYEKNDSTKELSDVIAAEIYRIFQKAESQIAKHIETKGPEKIKEFLTQQQTMV